MGRGKTVEEKALLKALDKGNVRLAILDVFAEEPQPASSSFWEHPYVIVTPHISAVTSPEEAVACFLETLENLENGKTVSNVVNVQNGY